MKASLCGADTFSTSRSLAVHITTMHDFTRPLLQILQKSTQQRGWLHWVASHFFYLSYVPDIIATSVESDFNNQEEFLSDFLWNSPR